MALRWAQRRKLIAWNAAELAEVPANPRQAKVGRSLNLDEAKALLDTAKTHPLGALVTVGVMVGLRPGELCGLRWCDVDMETGVLHVRQARKRETGPDGHELLTFGDPKTPKSRRSLDLPPLALAALRRHAKGQAVQRLRAGARWVDLDLVFATSIGTPINPSNLRRDMAALTESAGIGRGRQRSFVTPPDHCSRPLAYRSNESRTSSVTRTRACSSASTGTRSRAPSTRRSSP